MDFIYSTNDQQVRLGFVFLYLFSGPLTPDLGLGTYWYADRFYGFTENSREVEMDMREMVDKVKKGEPLYGTSSLSPHLQGVAARNSRYSQLFSHVVPWFNVVDHDQVSTDFPFISYTVTYRFHLARG